MLTVFIFCCSEMEKEVFETKAEERPTSGMEPKNADKMEEAPSQCCVIG